jgi:hypothetical protein
MERDRIKRAEERQLKLDEERRQQAALDEARAVQEFERSGQEHELAMNKAKLEDMLTKQGVAERQYQMKEQEARNKLRDKHAQTAIDAQKKLIDKEVPKAQWSKYMPEYFDKKGNILPYQGDIELGDRPEGPLGPLQTFGEALERKTSLSMAEPGPLSAMIRAGTAGRGRETPEEKLAYEQLLKASGLGRYFDKDAGKPKKRIDPSKLDMAKAALGGPKGGRKDSLWNLATGFNIDPSILGAIKGPLNLWAGKLSKGRHAESEVLYDRQIRGFASAIAKAMGEAGRLSDQDIERTVLMFPEVGDSPELTRRKLQAIWEVMNSDPQALVDYIKGEGTMPDALLDALAVGQELAEEGEGEFDFVNGRLVPRE